MFFIIFNLNSCDFQLSFLSLQPLMHMLSGVALEIYRRCATFLRNFRRAIVRISLTVGGHETNAMVETSISLEPMNIF